jgi:hypothetical protein
MKNIIYPLPKIAQIETASQFFASNAKRGSIETKFEKEQKVEEKEDISGLFRPVVKWEDAGIRKKIPVSPLEFKPGMI